jgi:hypothetical protein
MVAEAVALRPNSRVQNSNYHIHTEMALRPQPLRVVQAKKLGGPGGVQLLEAVRVHTHHSRHFLQPQNFLLCKHRRESMKHCFINMKRPKRRCSSSRGPHSCFHSHYRRLHGLQNRRVPLKFRRKHSGSRRARRHLHNVCPTSSSNAAITYEFGNHRRRRTQCYYYY